GIRDGHVTGVQTCALPIFDERLSADFLRRPFDTIFCDVRAPQTNVACYCAAEEKYLLENHGEVFSKRLQVPITQVDAIQQNSTRSEERRVGKECSALSSSE